MAGSAPVFASTATTDARQFQLYGHLRRSASALTLRGFMAWMTGVRAPSMVETAQVLGLFIRDWCGLAER